MSIRTGLAAILIVCGLGLAAVGCNRGGQRNDILLDQPDREELRAERRANVKKRKLGAGITGFVPFVGSFASLGLRQGAQDDEAARQAQADRAEANRDRSFPHHLLLPTARQIGYEIAERLPKLDVLAELNSRKG
ncbi:MAG: hypothetical protein AB7N71_09500 [Phycisphaerae bacterium]